MNASFTRSMVENEILGARTKITACGIPQSDIVGFRQPFLECNPTVRQASGWARQACGSGGSELGACWSQQPAHSLAVASAFPTSPWAHSDCPQCRC